MNGFLIDTNVLSEYNRPGNPNVGVKRWLETTDRKSQYVSVITLAEIQKGIELLVEGKRRARLRLWLEQDLEAWFSGRIIPGRSPCGRSVGIAPGGGGADRQIAAGGRLVDCRDRACL